MSSDAPGYGRQRVLVVLKTKGPQTAARIARQLGVTAMAVRQHLAVLQGEELVDFTDERRKVGRPARRWHLTPESHDRFPDGYAELALGMLQAINRVVGGRGLARVVSERTRRQAERYRARMPSDNAPLAERVAVLTRLRREEGYMPELHGNSDGTFDLVKHHCSIATAARLYPKLCSSELELFRAVLGEDVLVDRSAHVLAGDRCCAYRITERPTERARAGGQPKRRTR